MQGDRCGPFGLDFLQKLRSKLMHLAFVKLEFELEVDDLKVDVDYDESVEAKQDYQEANR